MHDGLLRMWGALVALCGLVAWLFLWPQNWIENVLGVLFGVLLLVGFWDPICQWLGRPDTKAHAIAERMFVGIEGTAVHTSSEWLLRAALALPKERLDPEQLAEELAREHQHRPQGSVEWSVVLGESRKFISGIMFPGNAGFYPGELTRWIEWGLIAVGYSDAHPVRYVLRRRLAKRVLRALVERRLSFERQYSIG